MAFGSFCTLFIGLGAFFKLPDPGSGVVGGSGVMMFHEGVVLTVVVLPLLRLLLLKNNGCTDDGFHGDQHALALAISLISVIN